MNNVFKLFLEKSVVVYLHDIVVINENMEHHKRHLVEVFEVLRQNQLYLKKSNCVFGHTKIPCLGHWFGQICICMDPMKIRVIENWEDLRIFHEVRIFVGLDNYYHKFVECYYEILTPLTYLLKKSNIPWNWMKKCQKMLCEMEHKLVSIPLLKLPNFEQ
jgi:hypothetical protein